MPETDSNSGTQAPRSMTPYTALAVGYDVVMEHVSYDLWALYVHGLLKEFHEAPRTVLELGCGTGSFALEFQPLGGYQYLGTDRSPEMIRVAQAKAELESSPVQFAVADFSNFRTDTAVDAVILLYDGLNYLLDAEGVQALFRCTEAALAPGGVFIFDQSTPANSVNNEEFFEDQGQADAFTFVRHSRYDPVTRLHTTTFDLTVDDLSFHEQHVQRAYTLDEIRAFVQQTVFIERAAYDDFSTDPATEKTERIHWVLQKPFDGV